MVELVAGAEVVGDAEEAPRQPRPQAQREDGFTQVWVLPLDGA